MGSASHRLLGVCAVLIAIAVANAASGQAASVVVGLAKCADCTRKNMKAEAAFKGLKVAIKCKDTDGEYKNKALGELQSSGAFSVPLSVDLHGSDCLAQLHNAAGTPCPGQEPSRITPLADGSFVAIPGNMQQPSAVCASVTICGPMNKHLKPEKPKPEEPEPKLEPKPKPKPEPKTEPEHQPPTPSYGSQTPIYHPPAMHLTDSFHEDDHDELDHFFDHFHKKPVPPKPEPQPKPQPKNHPPPPAQGSPTTPTSGSPTTSSHHFFDHFHKGHDHHHFFNHFHKKPVPPQPKPEPKPEPGNQAPTPSNGSPTPIYSPPPKY